MNSKQSCLSKGALLTLVALTIGACAPVITDQNRTTARLHYDMGVVSMQQGNINEAMRELSIAENNNPRMPEVHNALALAYHSKQQTEKAIYHYKKAIEYKEDFSEARNNYATLLMDLGRYDEAMTQLKTILEDIMYPTPHFAEANLGWLYHLKGDDVEAINHLRNALATDNNFCRGYLWLAEIYDGQQKISLAIAQMNLFFTRCIENREIRNAIGAPFISEANKKMGMLLLKDGQDQEAKPYFQNCAKDEINNGVVGGICQQALQNIQ